MGLDTLFKKVFDDNKKDIKKLEKQVAAINALEPKMAALSDEELRAKTDEFKARYAKGESLDDLLNEAYAVVREASKRVLGMRHFDVQIDVYKRQALASGHIGRRFFEMRPFLAALQNTAVDIVHGQQDIVLAFVRRQKFQ